LQKLGHFYFVLTHQKTRLGPWHSSPARLNEAQSYLFGENIFKSGDEFFSWYWSYPLLDNLSLSVQQDQLWLVAKIELLFKGFIGGVIHVQVDEVDLVVVF
jgi:hypothetical protein